MALAQWSRRTKRPEYPRVDKSNRNVSLSAFKDVDGKRYGTKYRTDQALGQRMARPNSRRTQRQGRKSVLFRYLPHLSHYLRCRHFFCPHVSGRKGRFSHQECALRRFDLMNKRVLPFTPRIVPLWDQNRNRRRRHSTHEIRQKLRFASLVLHVWVFSLASVHTSACIPLTIWAIAAIGLTQTHSHLGPFGVEVDSQHSHRQVPLRRGDSYL